MAAVIVISHEDTHVVQLGPSWVEPLLALFAILDGLETAFFTPHPFTAAEAARVCNYAGDDVYYAIVRDGEVLGYGFLRGWDEGLDVPSLGVAIHPSHQRKGLARMLMAVLHEHAARRNASTIRLRVHPENIGARLLYESLGYEFNGTDRGQDVGHISLNCKKGTS